MKTPATDKELPRIHPGSNRRRSPALPKGRRLRPEDVDALERTLGDRPKCRSKLIEYLHLIQDAQNCLPAGYLHALAEALRIPMAEVFEVASFYAHFDIIGDDEPRPAPITVRVCCSLSCMLAGAEQLVLALQARSPPNTRILRAPCMGRCNCAPVCQVGHRHVDKATATSVRLTIASGEFQPHIPDYVTLEDYRAEGGYDVLRSCLDGSRSVESVIATLSGAGLRGLGGAGFPTGRKWQAVRFEPGPRLMVVNADEGEPGTFKDRYHLETQPHRCLEGMLIGAWAVEAETVYIYLRDEYPAAREILLSEIAALVQAGLAPHTQIVLRRGAGAYICGEESAMIESIEGKRGMPRHRPPFVSTTGLFGRPTLVNNVETLSFVPRIIEKGAAWFASQGMNGAKGLRTFSVSGRVKEPGVKLLPAGSTVRDVILASGGMLDGHSLKGYLPGGASGGILPARMDDLPLEFGALDALGCFVGSHAVVILSDKDNTKDVSLNLMRFFEAESCGQCTPCRSGTQKAVKLMSKDKWDIAALEDLASVMADASICGLGQAAPNSLLSVLKYFPEDLE